MATTLYYVQNDTLPQIKLTFTDEITGTAKDLRQVANLSSNMAISMHVKPASGTGVSFTRAATIPDQSILANKGIAFISWQNGDLSRPAGTYNAEVEIVDASVGSRETIYDMITLVIREDIADITPPIPLDASTTPPPNYNPAG